MSKIFPFLLLCLAVSGVAAQNAAPAPSVTPKAPINIINRPSLKDLAGESFTSEAAKFFIALPEKEVVTEKLTNAMGLEGTAVQYKWTLREGAIVILHLAPKALVFKTKTDTDALFTGLKEKSIGPMGKLVSESPLKLGEVPGSEINLMSEALKTTMRIYLAGNEPYLIMALMPTAATADDAKLIRQAIDTFKILEPFAVLPVKDGFSSERDNFSIGLPAKFSSSKEEGPAAEGQVPATGRSYQWEFSDGNINISQTTYTPENAKKVLTLDNFCGTAKDVILKQPLFKMVSDTRIKTGDLDGCEMVISVNGQATGIFRYYATGTQMFSFLVTVYTSQPEREKKVLSALDTFRVLKK